MQRELGGTFRRVLGAPSLCPAPPLPCWPSGHPPAPPRLSQPSCLQTCPLALPADQGPPPRAALSQLPGKQPRGGASPGIRQRSSGPAEGPVLARCCCGAAKAPAVPQGWGAGARGQRWSFGLGRAQGFTPGSMFGPLAHDWLTALPFIPQGAGVGQEPGLGWVWGSGAGLTCHQPPGHRAQELRCRAEVGPPPPRFSFNSPL